jgi:hypothetical protein
VQLFFDFHNWIIESRQSLEIESKTKKILIKTDKTLVSIIPFSSMLETQQYRDNIMQSREEKLEVSECFRSMEKKDEFDSPSE